MKVCVIKTYASVTLLDVENMEQAYLVLKDQPAPVPTGYEIRVQGKKGIQASCGWGSPFKKDLDLDTLMATWKENQGKQQA